MPEPESQYLDARKVDAIVAGRLDEARDAIRAEVDGLLRAAATARAGAARPAAERARKLLYNVNEAAEQLGGISRRSLGNLTRSGELESVMVGGRRMIPDAALVAYVEKLRTVAATAVEVDAAVAARPGAGSGPARRRVRS
ncbi:helix-turn-helix domain-containing protein [Micromonospora sp. NPDC049730]